MSTTETLAFDSATFRRTLGMFATGIAVVTARSRTGQPIGLTISSFNSVSLTPPLVVWSLANNSSMREEFEQCSHYAINILSDQQTDISNLFASRIEDRFSGLTWEEGLGGAPVLEGCCAVFEVRNTQRYPGGDHVVFIGEVERCERAEHEPLIFFSGKYRKLREL